MTLVRKQRGKNNAKKPLRTPAELEEEQTRTLYVRIPHTLKDVEEIKKLLLGDFQIKVPRKSSRYCHVIFPNIKDKIKNSEELKKQLIDGKPIFVAPPKPFNLEKKKKPKQKKIVIPEPVDEPKVGKYLFISRIKPGTKASEIKNAFPGARTVALFKGLKHGFRQAKLKMSSSQLCLHYANEKSEWPTINGSKVEVKLSKKTHNTDKLKKKPKSLKIYDEEEQKKIFKTTGKTNNEETTVKSEKVQSKSKSKKKQLISPKINNDIDENLEQDSEKIEIYKPKSEDEESDKDGENSEEDNED